MKKLRLVLSAVVIFACLLTQSSGCGNGTVHQVIKMEFNSNIIKDGKHYHVYASHGLLKH